MALPFLDTNVFLRHLTQDHPDHSPKATAFLARVERGEVKVRTADTVIFETVFLLERRYKQPKTIIRAVLLPLLDLPGVMLPGKRRFHRVFTLYVDQNLPFADAYHAVLMERLKLTEIISFDTDFDHIKGIARVESY
jgi:predicted nucleic acid-binding protein